MPPQPATLDPEVKRQIAEMHEALLGDLRARRPGLLARVLRLEDRVGVLWKVLVAVAAAVAVGVATGRIGV